LTASNGSVVALREAMQPLGLTSLIPFVALVFVIAFLFLVNTVSMVWSRELPPYLSYQQDRLLFERFGEKEKLILFRKYPTADHFNSAYHMALEEYRAEARNPGPFRTEVYNKLHSLIKFAAVVAILTVAIATRNHDLSLTIIGKAVFTGVIAVVLWTLGLVALLYEQEQEFWRQWSRVRSKLLAESSTLLEKEITDDERHKLNKAVGRRWWRLYAFDPDRVRWFKMTFLDFRH